MQIGEMTERVGVNIQTIRFYERRELLRKPDRLPSGYRDYPEDALRRVRFIKSSQEVGFTLKEIKELIGCGRSNVTAVPQCERSRRRRFEVSTRRWHF